MDNRNRSLLVVGYGSLLSGYGLLAERRGGRSRLIAQEAMLVAISNARRGLAKPSSHGNYLAMDIEPVDRTAPIRAHLSPNSHREPMIGGLVLNFAREQARLVATREEYDPDAFERLIAMADRAEMPLGEYLLAIAERTRFDLLGYRSALRNLIGYTSPGYIFHPVPLDDGRVAITAIGSGFDGSGDPKIPSRRQEMGMDRVLTLSETLALNHPGLQREGQIGYFAECVLGGLHGVAVGDLMAGFDPDAPWARELAVRIASAAAGERERFMLATSLDPASYQTRCAPIRDPSFAALLSLAGLG